MRESSDTAARRRYEAAVEILVGKLKQDATIIGAALSGSLSHDTVWEKSDIDLLIISQDDKKKAEGYCLVADGINIHAMMITRSGLKKTLEGAIQSSFMHSLLTKSRMLYCRDEALADLFAQKETLGARDREIQLLQAGSVVHHPLVKAEKWLRVKQDVAYSFFWIMKTVDSLAAIETLLHGEITGREAALQALRHNPAFFRAIYADFIQQEKTLESVENVLNQITAYLRERIPVLYKPLLAYLAEADGPRSVSEISHYFSSQMGVENVVLACEWLAEEGVIQQLSTPVRLTEKSRVNMEEAAYYYEGAPA